MTTTHLRSPGELLAAIPHLLGFTPHDSIVVIGVRRSHHLGLVMRLDSADCAIPEVARDMGQAVGAHLERDGVSYALLVMFAEGPETASREALAILAPWIEDYVPVREEWIVSGGRFRSAACSDHSCCPPQGLPLPEAPAIDQFTGLAASWQPRVEPTAHAPVIPAEQRRRATRARDRSWRAREKGPVAWRTQALALWRTSVTGALDGQVPSDAASGRLLAGLRDVRVRDAIIVDLDSTFADAADQVVAGEDPVRVGDALSALLAGTDGSSDSARVDAAAELMTRLAGYAANRGAARECAPALTVAAIARWWRGEQLQARAMVHSAVRADPDYSLAHLVAAMFEVGASSIANHAWPCTE